MKPVIRTVLAGSLILLACAPASAGELVFANGNRLAGELSNESLMVSTWVWAEGGSANARAACARIAFSATPGDYNPRRFYPELTRVEACYRSSKASIGMVFLSTRRHGVAFG